MNEVAGKSDEQWVTKEIVKDYPTYSVPFKIDQRQYVEVPQKHAMCQDYPDAHWIREYNLVDYKNSIVIPWKNRKPHAGFVYHKSKGDAYQYLSDNYEKFGKLLQIHPECFV